MSSDKIQWWRTEFGELEIDAVSSAIRNENVSQGEITEAFEADLAELIGVEHVIATSSGTAALMMALIAADVGPGSEVIVPNRTWIATAHAAYLLGAAVVLVDVEKNRPVMSVETVEAKIVDNRDQLIDPVNAHQIVSMLEGAVIRGTGKKVSVIKKPLAGKTGTTNEFNDTWFIGFSPDLVVGIFVGFDTPKSLGPRETGASVASPIFRDFMQLALDNTKVPPFRIPSRAKLIKVNLLRLNYLLKVKLFKLFI